LSESGVYFGEIPETPGVWATGATEDSCRQELQEVLEDWIQLGLARGRRLPVIDELDINVNLEVVG
jgi:predicted RNase H-like HicB family nuclease